jgi:hypothetical protein
LLEWLKGYFTLNLSFPASETALIAELFKRLINGQMLTKRDGYCSLQYGRG